MPEGKKSKSGGGAKKIGRDKKKCERYSSYGKRQRNKIKKITRHLKNHPNDVLTKTALEKLK